MHSKEVLTGHKAIEEMFKSEQSYNDSLVFLGEVLSQDNLVKGIPVLLELKSIVPQLRAISDQLLANAKDVFKPETTPSQLNALGVQRTQLLKAFFELYPKCSNLYTDYLEQEKAKSESFKAIKDYVDEKSPARLSFSMYIIQPVQRGPRYPMLISAAIDYNEKLSEGHESKLSKEKVEELIATRKIVQIKLVEANLSTPVVQGSQPEKRSGGYFPGLFGSSQKSATDQSQKASTASSQSSSTPATEVPGAKKKYQFGDYLLKPAYKYVTGASSSSSLATSNGKEDGTNPDNDKDSAVISSTNTSPQSSSSAPSNDGSNPDDDGFVVVSNTGFQ